jgi:alpha-L-fucosidase 2
MDTGPPAAWQIDGNFGGAAGIAESLLQSHTGTVVILPALFPSADKGHFSGLVARGGFVVSAQWSGGLLQNATILSKNGNKLTVSAGTGQKLSVQGMAGSYTTLYLSTKPGRSYNIMTDV